MNTKRVIFLLLCSMSLTVNGNKVLIVSMDGFRWDYIGRARTPNFDALELSGTRADFIYPTFVTKTFPSHSSIATGLYGETHGIVGNRMFDPLTGKSFNMRTTDPIWWDGGEPLWVTVQRSGLKSAVFYWPGSEAEIKGLRPNIYRNYNESVDFDTRVDTVVEWLTNSSLDISLAMMYFHEPDKTGHKYGPDSAEVIAKVEEMDDVLGYLVGSLKKTSLWETLNLVVTSDHGMADVSNTKLIGILDYVNKDAVAKVPSLGPVANIMAAEGMVEEVFRNLSMANHVSVYRREDVPEHFHYSNNARILDIVAIADEHWSIVLNASAPQDDEKGNHGYDHRLPSMRAIFYARGPNIATGMKVTPFNSVDIYPMVCKLLGVRAAPNNGSLDNTSGFIRYPPVSSASRIWSSIYVFAVAISSITF